MTLDLSQPDVRFAFDAVRRAAELTRTVQQEMVDPALTKDDRSPVTVGDFAAQALIARLLSEYDPNTPLVGEEGAAALKDPSASQTLERVTGFVSRMISEATSEAVCRWIDRGDASAAGRYWTLDPIDGTKGFLRREQYAVALALVVGGKVQVAALGCPNLNTRAEADIGGPGAVFLAARGRGTWAAPMEESPALTRLSVSDRSELKDARVLRSVESGHTNVGQMGELLESMGVQADPVLMDSQAKYAVLASGRGDLLFRLLSSKQPDYREKIWDQAAGSLIVEEAGGRITDLKGRDLDFSAGRTLARNRGIVASNGKLHPDAVEALKMLPIPD